MENDNQLEQEVLVLSHYVHEDYDSSEHIFCFYSSKNAIKQQKKRLWDSGLKLELHITKRNVKALIEGAKKAKEGYSSIKLGYGEICVDGHNWEYPWANGYDSLDEILILLDKNTLIDNLLEAFEEYKKRHDKKHSRHN